MTPHRNVSARSTATESVMSAAASAWALNARRGTEAMFDGADRVEFVGPLLGPHPERPLQIRDVDTEDLQRAQVANAGDEDGDVPPGHDAVDEPPAGILHHLGDAAGDDVESVPHGVVGVSRRLCVASCGVKSRASASP